MIVSQIDDIARYRSISRGLELAVDWLMNHRSDEFVKGKYVLGNAGAGEVYVNCEEPPLLPREKAALEAHRRYIDIHVPLKGPETIGWAPTHVLKHVRETYDDGRDVAFFGDAAQSLIHLKVGQCAIFFPEDAHAPNIGLGTHRKLCIKIPIE